MQNFTSVLLCFGVLVLVFLQAEGSEQEPVYTPCLSGFSTSTMSASLEMEILAKGFYLFQLWVVRISTQKRISGNEFDKQKNSAVNMWWKCFSCSQEKREKKAVLCEQGECFCATFCGMQQTQKEHFTVLFLSPLV